MYISGSYHRFSEFPSQGYDPLIQIPKILLRLHRGHLAVVDQMPVVGCRLDLQIIVKTYDTGNLRIAPAVQKGLIQLPSLAGRPQQQALTMLLDLTERDSGETVEILDMGIGDQTVQIHPSCLIFYKDRSVKCMRLMDRIHGLMSAAVQFLYRMDPRLMHHFHQGYKDLRGHIRVITRPVMMCVDHAEMLAETIQSVPSQLRQQHVGQGHGIQCGKGIGQPEAAAVLLYEACIKCGIMCHEDRILRKFKELRKDHIDVGRIHHHIIRDGGEQGDLVGNGFLRIDKLRETSDLISVCIHTHGTDLDDLAALHGKTRGLDIENHVLLLLVKGFPVSVHGEVQGIIDKIALHTVDHLEITALRNRMVCHGKRLYHRMIRDGHCVHSPGDSTLYGLFHIQHTVALRESCMQMQFHPFLGCVVLPYRPEVRRRLDARNSHKSELAGEGIVIHGSLQFIESALLKFLQKCVLILRLPEDLESDGVRIVCHHAKKKEVPAPGLLLLDGDHLSENTDLP